MTPEQIEALRKVAESGAHSTETAMTVLCAAAGEASQVSRDLPSTTDALAVGQAAPLPWPDRFGPAGASGLLTLADQHPDPDGPCCATWRRGQGSPFGCTRPQGHEGRHVAHGVGRKVVAVWAAAPSP